MYSTNEIFDTVLCKMIDYVYFKKKSISLEIDNVTFICQFIIHKTLDTKKIKTIHVRLSLGLVVKN